MKYIVAMVLLVAATAAAAREECAADGKWINLDNGSMTANLTGVVRCTDEGRVTQELPYKAGQLDGIVKRFGSLMSSGGEVQSEYRAGKRHGWTKSFDPNGRLVSEVSYADDREFGPARYYHPNGKIHRTVERTESDITTLTERFDPDGRLTDVMCGASSSHPIGRGECRYRNFSGELRLFHANGQPAQVLALHDGRIDGVAITYDRNGAVQRREQLQAGYLNGPQQLFHASGKPSDEQSYRDGRPGPRYVRYFPSGDTADEWEIDRDIVRRERVWFMNGQLRAETTRERSADNRSLVHARGFHDNGKPAFEGDFIATAPREREPERSTYFSAWRIPRTTAEQRAPATRWGAHSALWQRVSPDGVHRSFDDSGRKIGEASFRDGRREGVTRTWYANGQLAEEATFANDRLTAKKTYDKSGQIEADEEYFPDGSRRRNITAK